jgi:hypothetical protein
MENKGLLFIPDISGFTRFVNETEIDHSRLIIQELLESLIKANEMGLEVSEIEGDAILFYRFGQTPALELVYKQVASMFTAFHRMLIAYEQRRYCQCLACKSAINLTLKIITHYGEFTSYQVRSFNKLIGKDIIVAHQLLKNDIAQHEYWLVTNEMLMNQEPVSFADWMNWSMSAKQTESGEISFHYTMLGKLKNGLDSDPPPVLEVKNKTRVLSISQLLDSRMTAVFRATADFGLRGRWRDGVVRMEEISPFLPRIGMKCLCVFADGKTEIYSGSYYYQDEKIEFSESSESRKDLTCFILDKLDADKTRLTINYYIPANPLSRMRYSFFEKRKTELSWQRSMEQLSALVKELTVPELVD